MILGTGSKQPLTQQGALSGSSSTAYMTRLVIKGNGNTDLTAIQNGDWSLEAPSTDLLTEKRESGAWVTKEAITP
jgi:hypothetical protein